MALTSLIKITEFASLTFARACGAHVLEQITEFSLLTSACAYGARGGSLMPTALTSLIKITNFASLTSACAYGAHILSKKEIMLPSLPQAPAPAVIAVAPLDV